MLSFLIYTFILLFTDQKKIIIIEAWCQNSFVYEMGSVPSVPFVGKKK